MKDKYASDVVLCLILYEINEPKIQLYGPTQEDGRWDVHKKKIVLNAKMILF